MKVARALRVLPNSYQMLLIKFLLNEHLLAVNDIEARSNNLLNLAACHVIYNSINLLGNTFNNCCSYAYNEQYIDNLATVLFEITELAVGITLWVDVTPVLFETHAVCTFLGRSIELWQRRSISLLIAQRITYTVPTATVVIAIVVIEAV